MQKKRRLKQKTKQNKNTNSGLCPYTPNSKLCISFHKSTHKTKSVNLEENK